MKLILILPVIPLLMSCPVSDQSTTELPGLRDPDEFKAGERFPTLRDLDEFVASQVGRTGKTGMWYGQGPCITESILELFYPDRAQLEHEVVGNALVVNAEKSPERLWEVYLKEFHRPEKTQEISAWGDRVDPQTSRILLGLAMSLDKVTGESYLMQALAIEDDPRIRGYLFLCLCWNLRGLGRPLREEFKDIPRPFDDLGRSFLGDAGATSRATRHFREVLGAFGEGVEASSAGLLRPEYGEAEQGDKDLRGRFLRTYDSEETDRRAYHDLLAMLTLWSRIGESHCLDEIAESRNINHGPCPSVRMTPLFNNWPADHLWEHVLKDPNRISGTQEWRTAQRKADLSETKKTLEDRIISSYDMVNRPNLRVRGSDRFDRLSTILFSNFVPKAAEQIREYAISRALEKHLISPKRREYVIILGRIGWAEGDEVLGKLSVDEDPYLAAEAIRSMAMRGLPLPQAVDRSDRSGPLASAILFHEAKMGSASERTKYLDFVRRRLLARDGEAGGGRQLFRELASLVELEDMEGLRVLVEILHCPDLTLAQCAATLIGTVVVLPEKSQPWVSDEWEQFPPLAYEPLRKTLEPTNLVATWDARRGYCVVSSRER